MREATIAAIRASKVIAIARGVPAKRARFLAEALLAGGIALMELTYDHSRPESYADTDRAISDLVGEFAGDMTIGAGTVITPECLDRAREAGAEYIISPDTNEEIIAKTRKLGLVSIPGALTPTEIARAYAAGADFVKLFPAGDMGAGYLKAVRAPLKHIPLLAVGGVNGKNAGDFIKAGAVGLGVGGCIVNLDWINNGEYARVTDAAREIIRATEEAV